MLGAATTSTLGSALEICLEDLGQFTNVDVAFVSLVDATVLRQLQGYTVSAASSDPFAIQDHLIEWAAGALGTLARD